MVLAAFALALYAAAWTYLHWQAEERLDAAADTLVASIDIEPDSVEWEPAERRLALGTGPLGAAIHWYITDPHGTLVDRSRPGQAGDLLEVAGNPASFTEGEVTASRREQSWLVTRRWVRPPGVGPQQALRPRTAEEIAKNEYPGLMFTAGLDVSPIDTALRALAGILAGLAVVVWLLNFLAGRWVCRRALRPLSAMADDVKTMQAEDFAGRLPAPGVHGELSDLHLALNALLDRLRDAFDRQQRFTGEVSHQLRTPLATILGQVEVTLRRPRSSEEYERVLSVIQRQAGDLGRAAEGLLFLARAGADAHLPALAPLDLHAWLAEIRTTYGSHARHADLSFTENTPTPAVVAVHGPLLRELLDNMLSNALKYTSPGTPVTVGLTSTVEHVTLSVTDQGPGIAAVDREHIFEPFYRGQDARRGIVTGAGLGLAVAERIAAALKARIDVASSPGQGACFSVVFPALATPTQPEEKLILASRPV